ncbi:MAG TPA: hypothetical protein VKQ08_05870 [Cyclobacteriaceae bacterium]|nr:hypothetical protein [Cyclobacteriaceae bacterium]
MKKVTFLSSFCLWILTHGAPAQVIGKVFPEMNVETVDDKKVSLPKDVRGKYTLIGLAYSKKSEDELNTWFNPIFSKFIQKPTGLMEGMGYDVNVYFVPMFTGVNAAATGTAKRKAIKNVDPQLLPYILFYKGELKKYKEELDFERRDIPYFFVLDPEGKILFATDGSFSPAKMESIEAVIDN